MDALNKRTWRDVISLFAEKNEVMEVLVTVAAAASLRELFLILEVPSFLVLIPSLGFSLFFRSLYFDAKKIMTILADWSGDRALKFRIENM
jgi:hypothetical protein